LPAFEILILPYPCCSSLSRHATVCTQPDYQHKDATEPPRQRHQQHHPADSN
jgi:hypothetical protein